MVQKLEAKGGKGGNEWDDTSDYDNVTKIHVRGGFNGVQFIKFDYVKDGHVINGPIHGGSGNGFTQTFEIDHLKYEYLEIIEGYYDEATGVIQGIKFKTNMKTSDLIGGDNGIKFSLAVPNKIIIGFHGFAETHLNALGAYFLTKFPIIRLPSLLGPGGDVWDDGGNYDGIKKVYVTVLGGYVTRVKFDYDKGGQVETREHGVSSGQQGEFVVDYPSDYITSVETYYSTFGWEYTVMTSLTFKTSKGVTSPSFGSVCGTKFVLESSRGGAIVGFHGRIRGTVIDGFGAYSGAPPLLFPSVEKLIGKGAEGGDSWDDGHFDGVRKIYVGQGENGIAAVKFVYDKDSQVIEGEERGKKTLLGYEEFELDYPSEYIIEVEGCFDKILGSESGVLTMLKFKTNKRTSPPFGLESTSTFTTKKEGYKIVGFHGKSSHEVHQIGIHVVPITE